MGPRAVSSNREPRDLLQAAGFAEVEATDLTDVFLETARAWYTGSARLERELREAVGAAMFEQQQGDRRRMIVAIEEGLLSRALFVGTKAAEATR